jgi:glycerol uptake facilitator-like aquaporin
MKLAVQPKAETCFFERDPDLSLIRRATAEGVGTLLLMLAATGSGLTVNQFIPESPLFGLIVSVVGTAGALTSLIVAFGSVSGGHFNPLITLLQCLGNERSLKCAAAYLFGQFAGAIAGAFSANAIFGAGVQSKHPVSMTVHLAASEFVAAAALMIVVFACTRSGRSETGPFAVGACLAAAIMATPSHCYANPAIVCAALFAAGPIALSAIGILVYASAEIAGTLLAFVIVGIVYPQRGADLRVASGQILPARESLS